MIDLEALKTTVAASIRLIIGTDLSQQANPASPLVTWGTVLNKRPNPKAPLPEYPYALMDILGIRNTEYYITDSYYSVEEGGMVYITHRLVELQVSLYGENSMQLCNKLDVGYRKPWVIDYLSSNDVGLFNIEAIQSIPEEYETNFIERAVLVLTLNVNDIEIEVDEELASSIETINGTGELDHYEDDLNPLSVVLAAETPI